MSEPTAVLTVEDAARRIASDFGAPACIVVLLTGEMAHLKFVGIRRAHAIGALQAAIEALRLEEEAERNHAPGSA